MKMKEYIEGKREIFEEQMKEFSDAFFEEFPAGMEMDYDTFEEMFYEFVDGAEVPEDIESAEEGSTAEEVTEPTPTLPAPGVSVEPAKFPEERITVETAPVPDAPKLQVDPAEEERIKAALAGQPAEQTASILKPHEKKALEKIKKRKQQEAKS